jgi:hypothetical protein
MRPAVAGPTSLPREPADCKMPKLVPPAPPIEDAMANKLEAAMIWPTEARAAPR